MTRSVKTCVVGSWSRSSHGCENDAHPDSTIGLCERHWYQAIEDRGSYDTVEQPVRCPECGVRSMYRLKGTDIFVCEIEECKRAPYRPSRPPVKMTLSPPRPSQFIEPPRDEVVYYLAFGERIKIGTSRNLPQRLKSIYHDKVLAIEPGGVSLERRRHAEFRADRVDGQREWFHVTDRLLAHVKALRAQHGEPVQAYRALLKAAS